MKRISVFLVILIILALSGCQQTVATSVAATPTPQATGELPPIGSDKNLIPQKLTSTPANIVAWTKEFIKKQGMPDDAKDPMLMMSDPDNMMLFISRAIWLRSKDKTTKQVYYYLATDKEQITSFSISSYKGTASWITKDSKAVTIDEAKLTEAAIPIWHRYIENVHNGLTRETGAGIQGIGNVEIIKIGEYKGVMIPFRGKAGPYGEYGAFIYWGTEQCTYECTLISTGENWAYSYYELLEYLSLFKPLK